MRWALVAMVAVACGRGASGEPTAVVRELEAFTAARAARGEFSGTLLVARGDEILLEKAWGLASRAWNAPNRVDTKLNLGSMNKMFTAVAIAQLVEAGRVGLDDTVGKHLPDFGNREVREKVTVRQLLTHTAGTGMMFGPRFEEKKLGLREVRDVLPIIAAEELAFEPGTRFRYSNSGYVLLGAIVEQASGENYFRYMRKHVYTVAGMADSDCYDVDADVPNLATGYTRYPDGEWKSNVFLHVVRGGPPGGGYSTVGDLLRFARALRAGKLVSRAMVDELTTGKVDSGSGHRYGFGFVDERVNGHRVVGHSGGFAGINANLDIFWDDGWIVVVLANVDQGATPIAEKARELITQ